MTIMLLVVNDVCVLDDKPGGGSCLSVSLLIPIISQLFFCNGV